MSADAGPINRRRRRTNLIWRPLLAWYLLLALLPPGFMPVFSVKPASGSVSLVFCMARGAQTRLTALKKPWRREPSAKFGMHLGQARCAYALAAAPALPPQPLLAPLISYAELGFKTPPEGRLAAAAPGAPLGARAPPLVL